jgi:hypothetical protein
MPHLVTNFLLAIKKRSGMGKTKYFVGSICSPLKTRRKREILLKLQKKNQAWIILCTPFICVPTTSIKKNLIIWPNSHILTPSKLSVSFWVYDLLCNLKFVFVRNASKGFFKLIMLMELCFAITQSLFEVWLLSLFIFLNPKKFHKIVLQEWSNSPKSKTVWLNRLRHVFF